MVTWMQGVAHLTQWLGFTSFAPMQLKKHYVHVYVYLLLLVQCRF